MSLEALVTLLDEEPPVGCMPLLDIDCLRLAGVALAPRDGRGEEEEADEEIADTAPQGKFRRLAAIQVCHFSAGG